MSDDEKVYKLDAGFTARLRELDEQCEKLRKVFKEHGAMLRAIAHPASRAEPYYGVLIDPQRVSPRDIYDPSLSLVDPHMQSMLLKKELDFMQQDQERRLYWVYRYKIKKEVQE